MPFDVAVALAVVVILFALLFLVIRWARGGVPHDDGLGGAWVEYVPEPDDPASLPAEARSVDPAAAPDRREGHPAHDPPGDDLPGDQRG
jgi:hypothetical protein